MRLARRGVAGIGRGVEDERDSFCGERLIRLGGFHQLRFFGDAHAVEGVRFGLPVAHRPIEKVSKVVNLSVHPAGACGRVQLVLLERHRHGLVDGGHVRVAELLGEEGIDYLLVG